MFLVTWLTIARLGLLCLFVASSESYKILFMPVVQGSHVSCILTIARALGERQHETHILVDAGYKLDKDTASDAKRLSITYVHLAPSRDKTKGETKGLIDEIVYRMVNNIPMTSYAELLDLTLPWAKANAKLLLLDNEPIIEQLKSAQYDLAVIDGIFLSKHFYLLAHRLGIPWITYTDYPDPWAMRAPWLPSIVPGKFAFQSGKMSLLGRILNAWQLYLVRQKDLEVYVPDNITKQYQQYGAFDSPNELMERSKFWILTSDAAIDSPRPIMPHMAEVGGLTTQRAKKLPEDIQGFLDGAEDGVIMVTFGTMMSMFPDVLLRKFLEAFNRIERHRIIWRLDNVKTKFQIPDFIRTNGWLPQNDILAHPKVKLFITHCGNNGQFEALYHGVPMIGFPIIGDQPYNAIRIEDKGFGIAMNVHKFTSDELYANIMKILNDSGYKRRISQASEVFRSAPQRPAERAAYWIEHVIKFGSDHLQSAGKDLNFFQFSMLDALVMCVAVGILLLVLAKKLVAMLVRKKIDAEANVKLKAF